MRIRLLFSTLLLLIFGCIFLQTETSFASSNNLQAYSEPTLYPNSVSYSLALNEMDNIPAGSLDNAKYAISKRKSLRVAFWGDSITEGVDQTSPEDAFPSLVGNKIKDALPNVNVNFFNFGVGSAGIADATNSKFVGGSGTFVQSWATIGKSWYNHVKEYEPDLIVIAFGMNDASAGSNYEYENLKKLINNINTWSSKPSVILVPNMLSIRDASKFWGYDNRYTLSTARATREFARNNKIAYADASRLFQILRDGEDDTTRINSKEESFKNYSNRWSGDVDSFLLSGTTLTPTQGTKNKFITRTKGFYNGSILMDIIPAGEGPANATYINYRVDSDLGKFTLLVIAGDKGSVELYTSDSQSPIATASGLDISLNQPVKINITVDGTSHKVSVNSKEVMNIVSYYKLQDGYISIGAYGLVPTFTNMTGIYAESLKSTPLYTEEDLLGKYNSYQSGNGINHPSGLGHRVAYAAAFNGIIKELTSPVTSDQLLPERVAAMGTPNSPPYPLETLYGENLYYTFVSNYNESKNVTLRRLDTGSYYVLSNEGTNDATVARIKPGEFAYYKSGTYTFLWISVPAGKTPQWKMDLYK